MAGNARDTVAAMPPAALQQLDASIARLDQLLAARRENPPPSPQAVAIQISRDLAVQQEAILLDFMTSGAMLRDLSIERGPVQLVAKDPQQPYLLTARQHFRVK